MEDQRITNAYDFYMKVAEQADTPKERRYYIKLANQIRVNQDREYVWKNYGCKYTATVAVLADVFFFIPCLYIGGFFSSAMNILKWIVLLLLILVEVIYVLLPKLDECEVPSKDNKIEKGSEKKSD